MKQKEIVMTDLFKLSHDELFNIMKNNIETKNLDEALVAWGLLNFEDIDYKRYYLAQIYLGMEKFDKAIYYGMQIKNLKHKEKAGLLILSAYSNCGDIKGFTEYFFNEFNGNIGKIQLINYIYRLEFYGRSYKDVKVNMDEEYNYIIELLESDKVIDRITDNDFGTYIMNTINFTSMHIESHRESKLILGTGDKFAISNAVAKTFYIYNLVSLLFPEYAEDFSLKMLCEDYDNNVKFFLESIKYYNYIIKKSKKYMLDYYNILERLADDNTLIDEITDNIDELKGLIREFGDRATYPVITAYSKAVINQDSRRDILEHSLIESGVLSSTLEKASNYEQVINCLSEKSKIAYKSACSIYNLTKNVDFGQKDAGTISLAFYRIIELESNIRIWNKIIEKISLHKIEIEYKNNLKEIDRKSKKRYTSKWNKLINIFKKIEKDSDSSGLMIGNMRVLLEYIKEPENDTLSLMIKEAYIDRLTDAGRKAYELGLIDQWYSFENTEKYRNPPAHAKYLHIETANMCKAYVEEQLINMNNWFK